MILLWQRKSFSEIISNPLASTVIFAPLLKMISIAAQNSAM